MTVDDIDDVDETAALIETLLKQFHEKEDYAVVVPKELLRQAERTRAMFNALLVVIAGISLIVGGIGIMNIMLATVTERTREIGIRRALGATRRHIVQQFLIETVVLTATGGVLGVFSGLMCGPLFRGLRSLIDDDFCGSVAADRSDLGTPHCPVVDRSGAVHFGGCGTHVRRVSRPTSRHDGSDRGAASRVVYGLGHRQPAVGSSGR